MLKHKGVDRKLVKRMEEMLTQLPVLDFLGYELISFEPGKAVGHVKIDPKKHGNPNRTVNGAVFSIMADTTTGCAAATCGTEVCTVSDENQYLHAGKLEGELICTAQVVKEGRSLIWTESRICDEKGTLLVKGEYLYYRLDPIE